MVFLTQRNSALVHDAAVDTDKLIFSPLCQPAQCLPIGKVVVRTGITSECLDQQRDAHFQRSRRRQATTRYITANSHVQTRDLNINLAVLNKHPFDIITPMGRCASL